MRKRILSLLTAAAIVVSFTGCAPQGTTGNSSENKETQDSQTKEEDKQTIKIGAVYPLTGTSAETGNQTINTLKPRQSLSIMNMILIIPLPKPRDFQIWVMQE